MKKNDAENRVFLIKLYHSPIESIEIVN